MKSNNLVWALVVASLWLLPGARAENVGVGKKAPEFMLKTLDGKTVKLSDYKGKKVILMNWWESG